MEVFKINKIIILCVLVLATFNCNIAVATSMQGEYVNSNINEIQAVKKVTLRFMRGYASFYGGNDGFDGRVMANGDVFDSNDSHLSAHPTLPLGTKLKVRDLSNNRVLYVEVTDRMPVHKGRVIDLSRRGAKYLGMNRKGLQKVELVKISDAEFARGVSATDNS